MTSDDGEDRTRREQGIAQQFYDQRRALHFTARPPGAYVEWLIGQIVDPDDVRFFDWSPVEQQAQELSGQVLLVTADALIVFTYEHVPFDAYGDVPKGAGKLVMHPLSSVHTVAWTFDEIDSARAGLNEPGIEVSGTGWSYRIHTRKYGTRAGAVFDAMRGLTTTLGLVQH